MKSNFMINHAINFNNSLFIKAVNNLSHAESLQTPSENINPVNWIAGHIVATRLDLLNTLDLNLDLPDNFYNCYHRGSQVPEKSKSFDINIMPGYYNQSIEILSDFINKEEKSLEISKTILEFLLHEAYHIGQIGLNRRFLGKETV